VSTPAVVWLTITLVSFVVIGALLAGLARHVMLLGRTLKRFQEEVTPLAEEIVSEGDRASGRSAKMQDKLPFGKG
jgi:hypothetical protein